MLAKVQGIPNVTAHVAGGVHHMGLSGGKMAGAAAG